MGVGDSVSTHTASRVSSMYRCDGCVRCLVMQSYVDEKKMMERERNRLQARKSRTLKKQCTEKLQQQLSQLREEAVRVVWRGGGARGCIGAVVGRRGFR